MFAPRYFAPRYYAPRYWPPGLGVIVAEKEFGGKQFIGFIPLKKMLAAQMPVDGQVVEYVQSQESETEFIIDGKKYELVEQRSPSQILREYEKTEEILQEAVDKLGVSRRKARKLLFDEVIKELKKVEKVKQSVFNDDEEIIMILVATDDL